MLIIAHAAVNDKRKKGGGLRMKKKPLWYLAVDWISRVLIAIIVSVIVVAAVQHRGVFDVFRQLLGRLSTLLEMKLKLQ